MKIFYFYDKKTEEYVGLWCAKSKKEAMHNFCVRHSVDAKDFEVKPQ